MKMITAEASRIIDAAPETVYAVLRDYQVAHPAIVPKAYFRELIVEEGGIGAGTVIRLKLEAFGKTYRYHQRVTEPEPGRVLAETDIDTGQFTRFVVDPLAGGQKSVVTIHAEFPAVPGLLGWLQGRVMIAFSGYMFAQELEQLAAYLRDPARLNTLPAIR